jgi:hypothetical protein
MLHRPFSLFAALWLVAPLAERSIGTLVSTGTGRSTFRRLGAARQDLSHVLQEAEAASRSEARRDAVLARKQRRAQAHRNTSVYRYWSFHLPTLGCCVRVSRMVSTSRFRKLLVAARRGAMLFWHGSNVGHRPTRTMRIHAARAPARPTFPARAFISRCLRGTLVGVRPVCQTA